VVLGLFPFSERSKNAAAKSGCLCGGAAQKRAHVFLVAHQTLAEGIWLALKKRALSSLAANYKRRTGTYAISIDEQETSLIAFREAYLGSSASDSGVLWIEVSLPIDERCFLPVLIEVYFWVYRNVSWESSNWVV
jgi:hypothetical protein